MFNWNILGIIGIFFAMIYRIPQIRKIQKTKKGDDISTTMFIFHNCAYITLLLYILHKSPIDYLIVSYYIIGMVQNLIIVIMKKYYKNTSTNNRAINDNILNTNNA